MADFHFDILHESLRKIFFIEYYVKNIKLEQVSFFLSAYLIFYMLDPRAMVFASWISPFKIIFTKSSREYFSTVTNSSSSRFCFDGDKSSV